MLALRSAALRSPPSARSLWASARRCDILNELDKQLNPREIIEQKRKAYEAAYAAKLKARMEAEGAKDLEELKRKVVVPSIAEEIRRKERIEEEKRAKEVEATPVDEPSAEEKRKASMERKKQAEGDRSGIKPLGNILNLPLIHLTPHTKTDVEKIWTAYHTAHPTLAPSFLSAALPPALYEAMLKTAQANPSFLVPLPRATNEGAFEMFFLQWLFHPTPGSPTDSAPLPKTTSVIFTPLAEYKASQEWAHPYLVLTHYPDLANSYETVLMRGDISPVPPATPTQPQPTTKSGYLLEQNEAQLLSLALQRFYCTEYEPANETAAAKQERLERLDTLTAFRSRPEEWDWQRLVSQSFGGLV